ncbi:MAG: hypothetical protein ACYCRG_08500 [Acidimicrobiales bacterium]
MARPDGPRAHRPARSLAGALAICPRRGSTVGYAPSVWLIVRPGLGSGFEVVTGDLVSESATG